jgi:hypothetical protein
MNVSTLGKSRRKSESERANKRARENKDNAYAESRTKGVESEHPKSLT